MAGEADLKHNLEALELPADARQWLLDLWNVIQVIDDAYDGDAAYRGDVFRAAMAIFWDMPLNPFYQRFQSALQPLLLVNVLKWQAANEVEDLGAADEQSYMWRAGYYDLVLLACHLCGLTHTKEALALYGETFAEYLEDQ